MSDFTDFIDNNIYPRLFDIIDQVFPEFDFRKKSGNWVSGNKLRLNGQQGSHIASVYVYSDRPYYIKDFSSGGKPITTYLQDSGKCSSWLDAIRHLANLVGVNFPNERDIEKESEWLRQSINKAQFLEHINDFFVENIFPIQCNDNVILHQQYLISRGYEKHLIRQNETPELRTNKMEIGFIPSQQKLKDYLINKDFSLDYINQCFFNPKIDNDERPLPSSIGKTHQLTVPFRDPVGRIQGFAFRNISWTENDTVGKYLYSSGLKKSSLLFNLTAIKGDKDLIIVEGLFDALYAKCLGIDNVVALGGTSFNNHQLSTAKKYGAHKITLCLDQDGAGKKATKAAIETFNKNNSEIKVYVATLPEKFKDPDELMRAHGAESFRQVIKKSCSSFIYLLNERFEDFQYLQSKTGELDDKDRDLFIEDIISIGNQIRNPIDRSIFSYAVHAKAESIGITKESLELALERIHYYKEKEQQSENLRKLIGQAQILVDSGKEDDAFLLLSNTSKQLNNGLLEATYKELLKPVSEDNLKENLLRKSENVDSGYTIQGDPLLIPSGAITILAAPTSHGKTSFQINIALNIAKNTSNKPVFFFSYEESQEAIIVKAMNTFIDKQLSKNNKRSIESYFRSGNLKYIQEEHRQEFIKEFLPAKEIFFGEFIESQRLNVFYVDYSSEELIGAIKYLCKHTEVGAVFIDYIQLLRLKIVRTGSRQEELKQICLDLKDCAVSLGIPLILGAQFNRTVINTETLHPTNIGEAGDIERIANLIIGFWNKQFPELDKKSQASTKQPTAEIFVTILKGRDISAGKSEILNFDGNTGKISNKNNQNQNRDMFG